MGVWIERTFRVAFWLFLVVSGIGLTQGWWTAEMADFQGVVLVALSVLVIDGAK